MCVYVCECACVCVCIKGGLVTSLLLYCFRIKYFVCNTTVVTKSLRTTKRTVIESNNVTSDIQTNRPMDSTY